MKKTVFDYYVMNNKGEHIVRCNDVVICQTVFECLKGKYPDLYFGWGKMKVCADEDVHLKKFEKFATIKL